MQIDEVEEKAKDPDEKTPICATFSEEANKHYNELEQMITD